MEKIVLRIFQKEVERQCRFALIAIQDLEQALQVGDLDRLWYSVQAFLIAVANISKLLWGSNPSSEKERAELRASLSLSDNSPIRSRKFRNHFEHFDERLEQWATSSKRHNFVDQNVGPPSMIVGVDPEDFLRNFDTENFAVTFKGEVYELRPVINAIRDIWLKAVVEAKKPWWE
jgi:hypothetical protein